MPSTGQFSIFHAKSSLYIIKHPSPALPTCSLLHCIKTCPWSATGLPCLSPIALATHITWMACNLPSLNHEIILCKATITASKPSCVGLNHHATQPAVVFTNLAQPMTCLPYAGFVIGVAIFDMTCECNTKLEDSC